MSEDALRNQNEQWLYNPTFPSDWIRQSLYSLAEWINGLAFRNIQFSSSGLPVIKIDELKNGITSQTKFTTDVFDEKVHIHKGDMLYSWSGQPETSLDVYWYDGPSGWLNQHIFKVLPKENIDRIFLFYLLKYVKPNLIAIARNKQTTGLGHVTKNDLENITIAYPSMDEQRAIAHILGTLDDKIELNRRMNETLEGIARALFKSWFIDFDPVRAKAEGRQPFGMNEETAALFPSEFEDSELGEIPKGWKVECVESICDSIENGGTPKRMNKDYWNGQISWFKTGELNDGPLLFSEETISDDGLESSACKVWPKGTVLVALYASPTVGRLGILEIEATANQACSALIAKPPFNHLFLFHSILFSRSRLQQIAVGAAQQNISQQVLRKHKILIPSEDIVTRYQDSCASLYHHIVNNKSNNQILSKLRDALLPKLISGDLRVNPSNFGFVPDE